MYRLPVVRMRRPEKKNFDDATRLRIRRYRKLTGPSLPRSAFEELVREITQDLNPDPDKDDFRWQSSALSELQDSAETHLESVFQNADKLAHCAERAVIQLNDVSFASMMVNDVNIAVMFEKWCNSRISHKVPGVLQAGPGENLLPTPDKRVTGALQPGPEENLVPTRAKRRAVDTKRDSRLLLDQMLMPPPPPPNQMLMSPPE